MKINDIVSNKEKVMKKIRDAFVTSPAQSSQAIDNVTPIFNELQVGIVDAFAENFHKNGGRIVYCEDFSELINSLHFFSQSEKWQNLFCSEVVIQQMLHKAEVEYSDNPQNIKNTKIIVTSCQHLVARTGSIVYNSHSGTLQKALSIAQKQIVIAMTTQVLPEIHDVFMHIKELNNMPSNISIVTGQSYLKDIEGNKCNGFGVANTLLFLVDIQ